LKIALGTAQFGLDYGVANRQGKISPAEAKSIIECAWENGISILDTAIAYGDSEQRLGEIGVQDWQVVSKLPALPEACADIADWLNHELACSRERLNIRQLYALLLHRPLELLEENGKALYQALQNVKEQGLVKRIGISIYDVSELDLLCAHYEFDLVQAPFNIVDRRILSSGWLSRLSDMGTEVHVRSIFLQGLLLMQPDARPRQFEHWAVLWTRLNDWLRFSSLTPLQACLNYPLSYPEIDKVLVGVDSLKQLNEIIEATKVSISPVPDSLASEDLDLVDPSRWSGLT